MCHTRAKVLLIVLFVAGGVQAFAQTGSFSNPTNGKENNPYSKYGIGEFVNSSNPAIKGMGGISSAYENPYIINTDNPASYSFLQRTTFEMSGMASSRTIVGSGLTYKTGTATLSNVNLGLPIGKNGGMVLGFRPYTHIYYNMVDTLKGPPLDSVIRTYNGEGGLNYAFLGGAYKYKGFSAGFNLGYLFGNLRNTTAAVPVGVDTNRAFNSEFSNYTRVGGLYWKLGLMYERKIDSNYTIRIGGTLNVSQNLTERLNTYDVSSYDLGDTLIRITTSDSVEQRGKLTMPLSYSIGVMLTRNDKWAIGIDYSATQWSGYKSRPNTLLESGVGTGSYKLSLGGEYTPDLNNIRNYFSRITYRMGVYYGSDYLKLQDPITFQSTVLPIYGFTLGASLPFRKSLSHVHTSVDIGRLGTTANNQMQHTCVRFTVGFSFNDRWFIPRKYD